MTPNYGTNPTDERRRQDAPPSQPAGQQPVQFSPTQQQPPSQPVTQRPLMQQSPQQPPMQQPTQQGAGQQPQSQHQPTQQGAAPQPQIQQPTQQQREQRLPQPPQTPPAGDQMQPPAQPPQAQGQQPPQLAPTMGQQAPAVQGQRAQTTQPFLKPARVNQIISEDVVTAERETPIQTVVAMMTEHDVGSVVVVEDDRPIGIITDRKVAMALQEQPDIAERPAEELLGDDLVTADPSMSIFDALQLMHDEEIRRLPIVDDDGALRGIVTLDDVLVLLGGVFGRIAETIEAQSPRV